MTGALRQRAAIAAALLVLAASRSRAGDSDHADFWRMARVSIDAAGKVTALEFVDSKGKRDIVGERLDPVIRRWTFQPVRVNGRPAATQTGLALHLDMHKADADGVAVTLLGADTGAIWAVGTPPPFPSEQARNGVEAYVLLHVDFDAEGKIVKTSVEDSAGSGSGWDMKAFVRATQLQAASTWRIRPEVVGGHAIAGAALVPVSFCIGAASSRCQALARQVAQRRAQHGLQTPAQQPMALDTQAKLQSSVAGTTL